MNTIEVAIHYSVYPQAMEDAKEQLRELKLKNKQLEVDIKCRSSDACTIEPEIC